MTEMTSPPVARRRFPKAYVAVWALLGSLSLAYLALLILEPDLVAKYIGSTGPATAQSDDSATIDTAAELRTLRESVDRVSSELASLKAEVSGQTERERDYGSRIAALEEESEAMKLAAAAPPAAAPAKGAKVAADAKAAPEPKSPAKKQGAAPAEQRHDALETGSVEDSAPVAFGPAVVTPAGPPVGLKIATGPSVDALRLSWSLLSGRHDQSLAALEPRYTTGSDASGLTYDLVVGPVASTSDAKRICKELVLKGTPCQIGEFSGDAL